MNRTMVADALFPDCPIRNILARISDKWSMLVIYMLDRSEKEALRFKELQRLVPDISQKMLTVTLRTLEEDGYVTRTVYPEVPPRVEYRLTDRARTLLPHIDSPGKEHPPPLLVLNDLPKGFFLKKIICG